MADSISSDALFRNLRQTEPLIIGLIFSFEYAFLKATVDRRCAGVSIEDG